MAETISRKDVCAAWLAGAFEGEGCVFAYFKKQTNPNCTTRMTLTMGGSIYNTHPVFIQRVTESLDELGIPYSYVIGKRTNGDKPGVSVTIQGRGRSKKFYSLIIPHLASKKRQAELVLDLIAYRESLVIRNQGPKGMYANMTLEDDDQIKELCGKIKKEKHDYPSVLLFSRKANNVLGVSSTTIRSPRLA
jgi:hypothetical protein